MEKVEPVCTHLVTAWHQQTSPKPRPYAIVSLPQPGLCIEGPVGLHAQKRMHLTPGSERPALQTQPYPTLPCLLRNLGFALRRRVAGPAKAI